MSNQMGRRAMLFTATAVAMAGAETPLACNMKALTIEERRIHKERTERLFGAAKVTEIEDGYAVSLPAPSWLEAAAWVEMERKCCPFLMFELQSVAETGKVVLRLSGRPGVKEFLAEELRLKRSTQH